jgi:hypothetical protein
MLIKWCIAIAVGLFPAASAMADDGRWVVANGTDGLKFGYTSADSSNFEIIWFRCDLRTKQVVVSASVGAERPVSGKGVVTLGLDDVKRQISGPVGESAVRGLYYLETTISPNDVIWSILSTSTDARWTGASRVLFTNYKGGGVLALTGAKVAVQQFRAGCR